MIDTSPEEGAPRGRRRAVALVAGLWSNPFLREAAGFGSSTVLEQVSRVGTGLVAAAVLGPTVWGSWYLLNLVIRYGALAHLGAVNGMNREVPAATGRGNAVMADLARRNAFGFMLLSYVALCGMIAVLALVLGHRLPLVELFMTLALLGAHQTYSFAATYFKASTRFGLVSRLQAASAIVFPLAAIPGALLGGLPGFILGQVITYAILSMLAGRIDRRTYQAALDHAVVRSLIRIGFPIMLVGVIHALLTTTDRWVIVLSLGQEPLGHYSLAIMAVGALQLVPMVFAQQVYPRMAHAWGATRDSSLLRELASRQARLALGAVAALVVPTALLAPTLVRTLLPAYEPGIGALLVSLVGPLIAVIGQGFGNILNVIDRQGVYLGLVAGAIAVNLVVSLLLVGPFGLIGVSVGTITGTTFLAAGLLVAGTTELRRASAPVDA